MKKTFKDVAHYYLGTGLIVEPPTSLNKIYLDSECYVLIVSPNISFKVTPFLRPLSSLTKSIIVEGYNDGKSFIPVDILYDGIDEEELSLDGFSGSINDFYLDKISENYQERIFSEVELLLKWHFNVFRLDESQYIEIKD